MLRSIKSILLIDDDKITNFLHQMLLEELSVSENIATAFNGEEALTFIRKNCLTDSYTCPDIIFLDLNMPGMDGFEFLEALEKLYPLALKKIHVVVVTSSNNKHDLQKAQSFSINSYISKPLTEEKISRLIENIL